jgi:hypothetical protein
MAKKSETPKYSNQVSVTTFVFLSMISFGVYEIVWFYRCWKFFKEKERLDIEPFWRAIFAIFFINSLFNKIQGYARQEGYRDEYSSGWRTFFWFIIKLMSRLPDPYWLISTLTFLPLVAPLDAMNYYLNKTEKNCQPRKWKWWHIVLIIIAVLLWILIFI